MENETYQTVAANVIKNSHVNSDENFQKISENIQNDFSCFDQSLEGLSDLEIRESKLAFYTETATAIGKLVDNDEKKSLQALAMLDALTNKALKESNLLGQSQYTDENGDHFLTSEIMKAYASCNQNTDRALTTIDNMNKLRATSSANHDFYDNLTRKGSNSYYDSLNDLMLNIADQDKEGGKKIATHILKTLQAPETKEGATAYLTLLQSAALTNPDCADVALNKIHKTFVNYNDSEAIQKSALSSIEQLAANRFVFRDNEFALEKMDTLKQKFKSRIDSQELSRKRGKQTDWDDEQSFEQQKERDFSKDKKQEIDSKIFEFDNEMEM